MLRPLALALAVLCSVAASAQPRPTLENTCASAWDVALVSRALSKHGVTREKATEILADIYNTPDEDSRRLVSRLADFAYQHTQSEPKPFAFAVRTACLHGRLGQLLGIEG